MQDIKKSRLIMTILATSLEEIGLAAFIIWGLPRLGVTIPLGGLIGILAGLATYSVVSYRLGLKALLRKPLPGFSNMEGMRGRVTEPLTPMGTVRIGSESWKARSDDCHIDIDTEVIVIKREGLKLIVRRYDSEVS
jgi:membrane protein implicated in regulation of membrane protease activity